MATSRHRLSPEVRLRRFLYTSTEEPRYVTSDPELHNYYVLEKLKATADILQMVNPDLLLNIIEIVHSENLVPRPETLFFTLAVAACLTEQEDYKFKHNIFVTLQNIIKTSEDLCMFLKFYTKQKKKFSSAINKLVCWYYMKKNPLALAKEVTKGKGYHSWSHKDLLKLSHCRCESVLTTVVVHYILFGLEKAKAVAEGNASATEIIDYLTKAQELKRCESEKRIAELVSELQCNSLKQIPSFYHNSQIVWEAVIPQLPLQDLITYLPKLYKLGFLKANTPIHSKVVEYVSNTEVIQSAQIHPVEVFIGIRNFEKGGKPLDPKFLTYLKKTEEEKKDDSNLTKNEPTREATKCPQVVSALHKAMQISFQNLKPTGRKFMITIDTTEKMQGACLNNRNLSCLDAAVILTLSLLRVERDVTVAIFNDNKINIASFEKNTTFNQAMSKLKQIKSGYVLPSSTFEWAMNKKKQVDVFIHVLFYHHWFLLLPKEIREKEKPIEMLNKYRKKMALPHTKLITFSLSSPHLTIADGSLNVLDICGFSKEVPKVVEAFSRGLFY